MKASVVAMVAIVVTVVAAVGVMGMSQAQKTGSTSASTSQCVIAGEPLYPTARLVQVQVFVTAWQSAYQVTVNQTTGLVTVRSASGGVGSSSISEVSFSIVYC